MKDLKIEAKYYTKNNDYIVCKLCPHSCNIFEGQTGFCRVRKNSGGKLFAKSYGRISSLAIDAIEKKPLMHFMPKSNILSLGSYGCNFRCDFCQNHDISMSLPETQFLSPNDLIKIALKYKVSNNIGVAYTYNEPLISYEYLIDCAKLIHEYNLKNVVVTNGYICKEPLLELLPFIDAMNIDLKGFSNGLYNKVNGNLDILKTNIELAIKLTHVEITTLIIPKLNDSIEEMKRLSAWLSEIDDNVVLHISRFFPRYKMQAVQATPISTIKLLVNAARTNLKYVYAGNI